MNIWNSLFGKKTGKTKSSQPSPVRQGSPEWQIGDRIENRYEIHQILGGGMGEVYICYDHECREPVVLKTFQDRFLENQQMRERFIREAQTWIALEKHQNIVKPRWVENIQGKPYIIIEYIANPEMGGADLGRWIRRGIALPQALNFAIQFCDGMDYAHKKVGIVHRDIKPDNILVTQDKVVKITDFGLVKTALAETSGEDFLETAGEEAVSDGVSFTRSGALIGTPPYMSPEQCRNAAEVDIRSDIYSFGAVLYEMLTGRWIFEATTSAAFMHCHLYEPPPAPQSVVPGLPGDLEVVVLRCLAQDPEQRYPDFGLLREELAKIYRTLTGKEPPSPVKVEALEAWEWSNKGISFKALERNEEAITCFDRALELDPQNAIIWSNKGLSLHALRRNEESLVCFDQALRLDPWDESSWASKGASLHALGCYEEALDCYDRALELDPQDAKTWYNKGLSLAILNDYEEALNCYDFALEFNPQDADIWYNSGRSLAALGYYEEAITFYDRALELDPRKIEAWSNKGGALDDLDRYEEALICCDHALNLDPRNVGAWCRKGIVFKNLGRFQEALNCFTKLLEIDPDNEIFKQAIVICQQELKQNDKD